MKRFSLCILVLGLLLLSACSAPDSSETGLPSGSDGVLGQEFGDAAQTGLKNILESVDPAKTGSEAPDTSDRNGNDEGSKPSASSGVPGESTPAKQQTDGGQSEANSQETAASSQPKQNESATPTEAPKEPAAESPAEPPAAQLQRRLPRRRPLPQQKASRKRKPREAQRKKRMQRLRVFRYSISAFLS